MPGLTRRAASQKNAAAERPLPKNIAFGGGNV
jgi:hypothetical protein